MPQMVLHERGYEVIPVVVALVPAQGEPDRGLPTGLLQEMRMQLQLQELIGQALIHEDGRPLRPIGHPGCQLRGVVGRPLPRIRPEIAAESLLPPWTAARRADG